MTTLNIFPVECKGCINLISITFSENFNDFKIVKENLENKCIVVSISNLLTEEIIMVLNNLFKDDLSKYSYQFINE